MKVVKISNMEFTPLEDEVCVAIGKFDGIHLGHQALIEESKNKGYKSGVLTFYPHPSIYLKHLQNYPLVTPIEHKIDIIKDMNVDYLIIMEFNHMLATMPKDEFIKHLKRLNIKAIVCGHDFTFGDKALGNINDLAKEFDTHEVAKVTFDNVRVSSTYTRELIFSGNVYEAAKMLGRRYSIRGEVVHGNKLGTINGFPTANVDYGKYLLPKKGVYLVTVLIDGAEYLGMCNIGNNPTFNYSEIERMEVNIFNFKEKIYGKHIEVFFIDKIRNEKKFDSKKALINQLKMDKRTCEEKYFEIMQKNIEK